MRRGSGHRTRHLPRTSGPRWLVGLLLVVAVAGLAVPAEAAPSRPVPASGALYAPEWMGEGTAGRLNLGFEVFVPTSVPAPFAGEPSVTAGGGAYELYWVIPGTPPTFLHIKGTVGGDIPDFSWYDRNVQLQQNATVQGHPAYHDLTPNYDTVYWQVGDVVYEVSSRNLVDTDSLTLANGLIRLDVPAPPPPDGGGEEPPPPAPAVSLGAPDTVPAGGTAVIDVVGAFGSVLAADAGYFLATGELAVGGVSGPVEWQAPPLAYDQSVTFVLTDGATGGWLATAQTLVVGSGASPGQGSASRFDFESRETAGSGELLPMTLFGEGNLVVNATLGSFPAQLPNTAFAPAADGGSALIGTLPPNGSAALAWQAPIVAEPITASFYATDLVTGNTPASWTVVVAPGAPPAAPPATAPPAAAPPAPAPPADVPAAADAGQAGAAEAASGTGDGGPAPAENSGSDAAPPPAGVGSDLAAIPGPADAAAMSAADAQAATQATPSAATPVASPTPIPTAPAASPDASPAVPPTPTLAPTAGSNGLVAGVIGPEGGTLTHPAGASISLPAGALSEPATVTIVPVPDPQLPVRTDLDFVPGTGFDVSVATANGDEIDDLDEAATLRLTLSQSQWRDGATIYWLNGGRPERLANSTLDREGVSAPLDHFSRFVVGVPVIGDDESAGLLPWIAAGTTAIALLVGGSIAVGLVRHRRPRAVITRRPQVRARPRY